MLAPPEQVSVAPMHIPTPFWKQQAWAPGVHVVPPQGIGTPVPDVPAVPVVPP
jgi:hypothetical protein